MLTDAGQVLFEHAERLLNFKVAGAGGPGRCAAPARGQLVIASNELTCLYLLPVLHEYRQALSRRPAVDPPGAGEPDSGGRARLRRRDRRRHLSARRTTSSSRSSCIATSWRSWCRRRIAFAKRKEVSIKELGGEPFVAHHVTSPYRAKVLDTFRKRRVTLQMPVEMPTIDAIKKFVATGNGVALLPAIAIEGELARGELVRVLVPELAFERPVRLVYRSGGSLVALREGVPVGGRSARDEAPRPLCVPTGMRVAAGWDRAEADRLRGERLSMRFANRAQRVPRTIRP